MLDTEKLLKLIAEDAKLTNAQLAAMLGAREEEVASAVASLEKEGIIKGYKALIDWDKTDRNLVSARIEIKVIPKGSMGFEEIAYTISQFREVETLLPDERRLRPGAHDQRQDLQGHRPLRGASARAARTRPVDEHPLCAEKV